MEPTGRPRAGPNLQNITPLGKTETGRFFFPSHESHQMSEMYEPGHWECRRCGAYRGSQEAQAPCKGYDPNKASE